jgi:hypothetical protein
MVRGAVTLLGVVCACLVGVSAADPAPSARAPAVSSTLVPNTISFWDAERGLIGSGLLYCDALTRCAAGAISLTIDGGRTSRVLLRTAGPVEWVSVAAGGFAWAVVDHCTGARAVLLGACCARLMVAVPGLGCLVLSCARASLTGCMGWRLIGEPASPSGA